MPKADLSIVITCFNKDKYLQQCLDSVINQSYPPKEIILVHDGCDNDISYSQANTLILGKNVGVAKARNTGFKLATSKFVMFLDGDDWLSLDYIQKAMSKVKDIAYSDFLMVYEDRQPELTVAPTITPLKMLKYCQLTVSSVMRREVFEKLGGFREFPLYEDWEFWLRAMTKGFKFTKFSGCLHYRQLYNTRNHQSRDVKLKAYQHIKQLFKIKEGKLTANEKV